MKRNAKAAGVRFSGARYVKFNSRNLFAPIGAEPGWREPVRPVSHQTGWKYSSSGAQPRHIMSATRPDGTDDESRTAGRVTNQTACCSAIQEKTYTQQGKLRNCWETAWPQHKPKNSNTDSSKSKQPNHSAGFKHEVHWLAIMCSDGKQESVKPYQKHRTTFFNNPCTYF